VLSDTHTPLLLYTSWLGHGFESLEAELFERALSMRAYGPSLFRLELEDAILAQCLEHAQAGFDVPMITFVDLRELLTGATSLAGPYSHAPRRDVLMERAKGWKMERALYASVQIVKRLFPETQEALTPLEPALKRGTRELLERLVISPVASLGHHRPLRATDRLRRLLTGGRKSIRPLECQT
jgi:hypothetical protein